MPLSADSVVVPPCLRIIDSWTATSYVESSCPSYSLFHQLPSLLYRIYGDWEESYNKVSRLLQALQSCCPGTVYNLSAVPYYDGHFMVHGCSQCDKVFWSYAPRIEAFKHCNPFVSVDGTHLYGKCSSVLLIVVAQDGNSNILSVAFAIVEFVQRNYGRSSLPI
ncbi:hypothetical protein Ahy_B03g066157 [Arachis hypogaea]|uniref:MULE transposase domain-containing protein n=1 Tax=Arachis hypogaea TaxID=3818 RepID=A0A445A3B4_ARAHY|nr:hypothetical protein Ahy_B03g066157 [Arachis hypogaea]